MISSLQFLFPILITWEGLEQKAPFPFWRAKFLPPGERHKVAKRQGDGDGTGLQFGWWLEGLRRVKPPRNGTSLPASPFLYQGKTGGLSAPQIQIASVTGLVTFSVVDGLPSQGVW